MTGVETAVAARAALGEGPTWDADGGRLLWVDVLGSRVHTFEPATGRRTSLDTGEHVGAVKPRAGGGLVANLRDGVGLYAADGSFRWLVHDPVEGRRGNDAAVAPDGALWAGTMRYDERQGGGTLSRIDGRGTVCQVLPDVTVSNGTGWSPDGRFMYYVDSPTRRIDVFDVAGDGARVTGRRPLAVVEEGAGFPDGLCVDADGCVWVALWEGGALRRYTPAGTLDRVVELPVRRPTACAFGGSGLGDLYVSTARVGLDRPGPHEGSLLVLPGVGQGLPGRAFAG
ncbi:SMP-30/gluconolactonase/LRE family protein [Streptomyces sp. TRM 70351]|uniref:SMP-30/gluconolactonase/LRE family protein n=1 Tax=Streptomyces sp. TRM 70351 TaxID=3116552 RepID=UPI002E7C0E67|nr:SMP-30/gluconolactonase/LRE family protein [Streptomyces sp. TRM 70351]MEE1930793.1 SMP-30/gluconolactonase/LRE family protein [Streptomyces sp. TRM 70351]